MAWPGSMRSRLRHGRLSEGHDGNRGFRMILTINHQDANSTQGPLNGGVSNGGASRSGLFLPFFVLFCPFWDFPDFSGIFPICSGMVRGFSRFVPFLFFGLLRAPTRNSPERVRDTIWTFPEKSGKPPGLGLACLNRPPTPTSDEFPSDSGWLSGVLDRDMRRYSCDTPYSAIGTRQ